jgi:hypothetical protein
MNAVDLPQALHTLPLMTRDFAGSDGGGPGEKIDRSIVFRHRVEVGNERRYEIVSSVSPGSTDIRFAPVALIERQTTSGIVPQSATPSGDLDEQMSLEQVWPTVYEIVLTASTFESQFDGFGNSVELISGLWHDSNAFAAQPEINIALAQELDRIYSVSQFEDPVASDQARLAWDDALELSRHTEIAGKPVMEFSSDGLLTIYWRRADRGVALIFAGDRQASIAFRRPGRLYSENGIEASVEGRLPEVFYDALKEVLVA